MDLIVAVDENWAIGKENDLLFHVPEDMKFFREMTSHKSLICGRKTLESFPGGKPLPNRVHFVLTTKDVPETEQVIICRDLDDLFAKIAHLPSDQLMVIGGGSVYRQLLPYCTRVYVTKIHAKDVGAEVFFPNLDERDDFVLEEQGETQVSQNGLSFSFATYFKK